MIAINCERAGDFRALVPGIEAALAEELGAVAADIRDDARERVMELRAAERPLPSALAESIAVADGGDLLSVLVRADAPHAAAVEFGTRHMPPRPFLQPAAEGARGGLAGRVARALRAAFRGWRP